MLTPMALTLGMVTTDTTDARALAGWWAEQTGAEVHDSFEGEFIMLIGGTLPVRLAFQQVDEATPGKNRLHLDLTAPDLDAEVEQLLAAAGDAQLVVARSNDRVHPIFALWHASMLSRIEHTLESGATPRLVEWIEEFNPVYVDFSATGYDPFFNINTPQDLYSAEAQLVHVQ